MRRSALLLATMLAVAPARAQLSEQALARAVARPPAAARLPAGLVFRDLAGRPVSLGAAAEGRPAVLLFVDYSCTHICGPGLSLTAGALVDAHLDPTRYRLILVGLDPRDGAGVARAMVAARIAGAETVRSALRPLLGDARATPAAAHALGYGYVADPASDQFAHDASAYVFAADGRLVTVLPELGLKPATLAAALAGAPVPSILGTVARLCFGEGAVHGRHGAAVFAALRGGAVAIVAALGLGLLLLGRRRRKRAA